MFDRILAGLLRPASVPDPGIGQLPGGAFGNDLNTLLSWIAGIATACCLVGILSVGASMALSHQRGQASQHLVGLMWVLVGCMLIASATFLVTKFT